MKNMPRQGPSPDSDEDGRMGPVSFGGPMIHNGRIAEPYPAHRAKCPGCGQSLRRVTVGDGGELFATCDAKKGGKPCGQHIYLRGWHGYVAVVVVRTEEWDAFMDRETGEPNRLLLREYEIPQAAFAALATVKGN